MADENGDQTTLPGSADDGQGASIETMSDHSTGEPSPCGAERESELMASERSEEALKPRAWLFKKLASILKGWVAKEVIALNRLAIPIVG